MQIVAFGKMESMDMMMNMGMMMCMFFVMFIYILSSFCVFFYSCKSNGSEDASRVFIF